MSGANTTRRVLSNHVPCFVVVQTLVLEYPLVSSVSLKIEIRATAKLNKPFPGDSIRPVDPIENYRIRYRIAPESAEFPIKTDRNPSGFRQIPS